MQAVRALKECLAAAVLALLAVAAGAAPRTVCTITVNSPDEKESFRRHLGSENYRFVELVERGRADWLDSSCRAGVACDILVISAHYDGGNEFFPDSLDAREFLPVSELERVSCSGSCPALFSRLQEVYLFGCNTLNPEPHSGATAEVVRSLVREGVPKEQAERELKSLTAAQGESSRDRMRQVFDGVPTIYGFSSTAPVGPIASRVLDRYFQWAPTAPEPLFVAAVLVRNAQGAPLLSLSGNWLGDPAAAHGVRREARAPVRELPPQGHLREHLGLRVRVREDALVPHAVAVHDERALHRARAPARARRGGAWRRSAPKRTSPGSW